MENGYGLLTLLPVLLVIVLATITRSSFEPLVIGLLSGCVIAYQWDFLDKFIAHLTTALTDEDSGWVILVCMLYGSLITMMIRSGGTKAFGNYLLRYVQSGKSALLSTWVVGLLISVDDYLHSLAVGTAMKRVTDKFQIPREMLAYVVHATSAPLCILLPFSTWSVFISRVLEDNKLAAEGQGLNTYINLIPYLFFSFTGLIIVLLVIFGIIPAIGKMKEAMARAATGKTIPEGGHTLEDEEDHHPAHEGKIYYFFLPLLILIGSTLWFNNDALKGVMITNFITFIYFAASRVMSLKQLSSALLSGFNTILFPIILVILALALKLVNDDLHLVQYVIGHVSPYMTKELLPAVAFFTLALIAFMTGSSWDLYIIAIPIVIPLAQSMDANLWMAVSTVVCAGAFGSQAGFFSDSTILSATSANCPTMTHAITQFPYMVITLFATTVVYLVMGFLI
ncbi:MAG: sodium:proton antiporter [Bacteroidetes bacterium]|nr:sodium:proton antiporter [Bacteroidota bacterium]